MNEEEVKVMEKLGITAEPSTVFTYKGHKYQKLDDAVRYAEIDRARPIPDATPEY